MLTITFERETGRIIHLGETFKNFNTKMVTINDVSYMKYITMDTLDKIAKLDRFGRPLYAYGDKLTSIISKVYDCTKGAPVYQKGGITLYNNTSETFKDLDKSMEYGVVGRYYSFPKDYKVFNIDEIMLEYYQGRLEASDCQYALSDNFSELKNILIHSSTFKSINKREIILGPGDHLKLKAVTLTEMCNVFKILDYNKDISIYINDLEIDSVLDFKKPIDKVNISFKNNTKNDAILDSILIGYTNIAQ